MKRKYVAIILGLTVTMTSMNMAYAADSSEDAAAESVEETTVQTEDDTMSEDET